MLKYIFSILSVCLVISSCCSQESNEGSGGSTSSSSSGGGQLECPKPECISAPQSMLSIEGVSCKDHFECQKQVKFACYDVYCINIDGEGNGICHIGLADNGMYCGELNGEIWQCDSNQKCCPPSSLNIP